MAVFAYEQETYRPVEFKSPTNIADGLTYAVKIYSSTNVVTDVTSATEIVISDKSNAKTVVICDFATKLVPPGTYTIVVQTVAPVTVISKDKLILFNKTGFSLDELA